MKNLVCPTVIHRVIPNTFTKKLNGFIWVKHITNGTSSLSPGLREVFGGVNIAPTPPGPPSAFCSKFPFVRVVT